MASSNISSRKIGLGLMGFTWTPTPASDEQAFAVLKESIKQGATFWNSGSFYNMPDSPLANLKLIRRYFDKYPEDASKISLSIKTGLNLKTHQVEVKPEDLRTQIDEILDVLGDSIKIAIIEPCRIDKNIPLEDIISTIADYAKAGKIGGVGLTECSAESIRKAHAVYPLSAVEVEFSMSIPGILSDGVAATCAELGIPIAAYSPLSRGLIAGRFESPKDGSDKMAHLNFDQYKEDSLTHNWKLYEKVQSVAKAKNATPAQVSLAWIIHQSGKNGNPIIIPIPGASKVERAAENFHLITLTDEEFEDLNNFVKGFKVQGERYNESQRHYLSV